MDPASRAVVVIYLAHVVLGAVQASIIGHFYRLSRLDHLRWWTWSFVASCIYHAFAALAVFWLTSRGDESALRLLWTWISQTAVYVQVMLLLLGSVQVIAVGPLRRNAVKMLLWTAVLLGTAVSLAWAFAEDGAAARLWLRVGARYLLCGAAFMATAVLLWRKRSRHHGLGLRLVAGAYAAYSLLLSCQFVLFVLQRAQQRRIDGAELAGIFDLVAQACIAFGLILWMAEDERRRADQATADFERARRCDASTGLPNRAEMERLIDGDLLSPNASSLAVFSVDLLHLEPVARSEGAHGVERIAREASERLLSATAGLRARVGRLNTYRFAVTLDGAAAATEWERRALDWVARLELPYVGGAGGAVAIECSVGIAVGPGDAADAARLLAHAEQAVDGRHRAIAFYSPERDRELRRRLAFADESLAALRNGQIVPFFQPIVSAEGSAIAEFEVLARWLHPSRGVLLPGEFLDVFDDRGAMAELDRHMLSQACRYARRLCVPRIALNVSAHGFERLDLVADVKQALLANDLPASALCLEITESTALLDLQRTRAVLLELRELGVRVALDDFGTGYSSLVHLRDLPIDAIKIDRSFVQSALHDATTAAIIESLVPLAHRLHLQVVVEGVQTTDEFDYFRRLGATHFQGWLMAPAYPFEEACHLSRVAAG